MIMGDLSNEPAMEEILASIRRIIAEEGEAAVPTPKARAPRAAREQPSENETPSDSEDVLELTTPMAIDDPLLSESAAEASRRSLAALAMSVTKPGPHGETMIEE